MSAPPIKSPHAVADLPEESPSRAICPPGGHFSCIHIFTLDFFLKRDIFAHAQFFNKSPFWYLHSSGLHL